jgi:hypothetical protein
MRVLALKTLARPRIASYKLSLKHVGSRSMLLRSSQAFLAPEKRSLA